MCHDPCVDIGNKCSKEIDDDFSLLKALTLVTVIFKLTLYIFICLSSVVIFNLWKAGICVGLVDVKATLSRLVLVATGSSKKS